MAYNRDTDRYEIRPDEMVKLRQLINKIEEEEDDLKWKIRELKTRMKVKREAIGMLRSFLDIQFNDPVVYNSKESKNET